MSIDSEVRRSSTYYGNGLVSTFPFTFKVFSPDQALAVMASQVTGDLPLTYGVDYTVALNVDQDTAPGGSITLISPLAYNFTLVIKSGVPYTQLMKLTNHGNFYPTVLNDAADKAVILIQQIIDTILHPPETQALQRVSYAESFAVTGTTVHIDFPDQTFVLEPVVYVCINGAVTQAEWVLNTSVVGGASYYTSIDLTFQAGAVGKQFSLIVVSNG
jgi:hypothetical protein